MTKSGKFEKFTKKIAEKICNESRNLDEANIKQGLRNKIEGNSGYKHQIDVSIATNDLLVLIECKKYNKDKVDLSDRSGKGSSLP